MVEKMKAYQELSKEELQALKTELETAYVDAKGKGLKLDMSRGKPSVAQLDIASDYFDALTSQSNMKTEDGIDVRGYFHWSLLDNLSIRGSGYCLRQRQPVDYVRYRFTFYDSWCYGKYAMV